MASAVENWGKKVRAHYSQNTAAEGQSQWASGDHWRPLMANFKVDPHRTNDSSLDRSKQIVGPASTVIDVGGGAGRYALPLSFHCKQVTVVEPADSMVDALKESMQEENIGNVSVIQSQWEDAAVEPGNVVLSAFSVYGVPDVVPFIRKLEAKSKDLVIMLVLVDQPESQYSPLWKAAYGEERIDLPALSKLMNVLWEMDIFPSLEMLEPTAPQLFESREAALERIGHTLSVGRDSSEYTKLRDVIEDHLIESAGGFLLKDARPRRLGIITWRGRVY